MPGSNRCRPGQRTGTERSLCPRLFSCIVHRADLHRRSAHFHGQRRVQRRIQVSNPNLLFTSLPFHRFPNQSGAELEISKLYPTYFCRVVIGASGLRNFCTCSADTFPNEFSQLIESKCAPCNFYFTFQHLAENKWAARRLGIQHEEIWVQMLRRCVI